MPMPTPLPNDDRATFLERCMADPTMTNDYPERSQRFAVCLTQWTQQRGNKQYTASVAEHLHRVVS